MQSTGTLYVDVSKLCGSPLEHPVRWSVVNELKRTVTPLANNFLLESDDLLPVVSVSVTSNSYPVLVYTKTVDSFEGTCWLVRQTPNILCYLAPSNSRENGIPVCIHDKWRNDPNWIFVVYIISLGRSRIFVRRGCTSKEWRHYPGFFFGGGAPLRNDVTIQDFSLEGVHL